MASALLLSWPESIILLKFSLFPNTADYLIFLIYSFKQRKVYNVININKSQVVNEGAAQHNG